VIVPNATTRLLGSDLAQIKAAKSLSISGPVHASIVAAHAAFGIRFHVSRVTRCGHSPRFLSRFERAAANASPIVFSAIRKVDNVLFVL